MNPEERQLLERAVALGQENNQILRGIRRSNWFAFVSRVFYWIIVIGLAVGAYVYIQPFVDRIVGAYQSSAATVQKAGDKVSGFEIFLNNIFKK